jgi:hypothetical protein
MVKRQSIMDHALSPTGELDKPPPSGMFITIQFKRRKDKDKYV